MGDAIAETFQTRATHIQDELQAFFHTKETMLKEVKHHIQLQQKIAQSVMALTGQHIGEKKPEDVR